MRARCAIALVPLLVAGGVTAGCSPAASPVVRASAALSCGSVLDPDPSGYFGGPLTTGGAVALLSAVQRSEGKAGIAKGTLSSHDRRTLDTLAAELVGFAGNKLSSDAAKFASAEVNYSPAGLPVVTAYARSLEVDIAALERDCPSRNEPGVQRPSGGN
jgi:hypothetical protein